MAATTAPRFAGPWAVEEDVTFEDIDARRRHTDRQICLSLSKDLIGPRSRAAEADYLRDLGIDDDAILARALGVSASTYERYHKRHQVGPLDRIVVRSLDRLIESGQPFTVDHLPTGEDPTFASTLVRKAVLQGLVIKIKQSAERGGIYQGRKSEAAVSDPGR